MRNGLLISCIKHCRMNPRAEAKMSILIMIMFLADNATGICYLGVMRMAEIFQRTKTCIINNIAALESDGLIGVNRKDGMLNCYWPLIPAALAEMSANPIWFVDALSTKPRSRIFKTPDEAIVAAIEDGNLSTTVDRSIAVNPSTAASEPVNCSERTGQLQRDSISSLNLTSNLGGRPYQNNRQPAQSNGQRELAIGLGGEAAYAENNVTVSSTGKLVIGEEFRNELRQAFSDQDIDDAVNSTLAVMGADRSKTRILQQVRRQCGFARRDNGKAAAFAQRKPGVVRNGRPSL
jgi:hypothetical protein